MSRVPIQTLRPVKETGDDGDAKTSDEGVGFDPPLPGKRYRITQWDGDDRQRVF